MIALTILLFIGILALLIIAHEWGHFIVARKAGIRVDEFGFG
ncbi:MAG: site-2 protease family protein, partial [Candidatus Azambacteria bacterium]|nr:site-2 protease family protein [Candidatus Azambacteria bacterium]